MNIKNSSTNNSIIKTSLKTKILTMLFLGILLVGFFIFLFSYRNFKLYASDLAKNNMLDLAVTYGTILDQEVESDPAVLDQYIIMRDLLQDAHIKGLESSYAYLVSKTGRMIYHPDSSKVGEQVENAVVTGVVNKISRGEKVESEVTEYDFRGTTKYAGYYVPSGEEYIIVISADKSDILSPINNLRNKLIASSIGILLAISLFVYVVCSIIIKPLNQINTNIAAMSEGHTNLKFNYNKINHGDEIRDVAINMTNFIETLRNVLAKVSVSAKSCDSVIASVSDHISTCDSAADNVNEAVAEIASGANEMTNAIETIVGDMDSMGVAIDDVNNNASESHNLSATVVDATNVSGKALQELIKDNQNAKEIVSEIVDGMKNIAEVVKEIQNATDLIENIAKQTNLLSLNASIEAAHAGDNGKGFAVVAEEIKKLAEQSAKHVVTITEVVDSIVKASRDNEGLIHKIETSIEEEQKTLGTVIENFSAMENKLSTAIKSIDTCKQKTEDLNALKNEVIDAVSSLSAISEENAASTEETAASITVLRQDIENIDREIQSLVSSNKDLDETLRFFKN